MQGEIDEATTMEDRVKAIKEELKKQHKDSEAKQQKLYSQLLEKIEELSVGRNYAKLIGSQIEVLQDQRF